MIIDQEFCGRALQNLRIHAQRIVDTEGTTLKVELLSRLENNEYDIALEDLFREMTPAQTLEVAERQMQAGSILHSQTGISASINVDNSVLVEKHLQYRLLEMCERYRYPMILEFTELRPMPPADEINRLFFEIKQHDITIALDDFGTGFNGMSVFADYDFDIIKIDRSMISGIESRPQKQKILHHIRELLDALDKTHVVEGVETEERYQNLVDLGFTTFQGYLFHRPESVGDIR